MLKRVRVVTKIKKTPGLLMYSRYPVYQAGTEIFIILIIPL
jgi:hypothetical protein